MSYNQDYPDLTFWTRVYDELKRWKKKNSGSDRLFAFNLDLRLIYHKRMCRKGITNEEGDKDKEVKEKEEVRVRIKESQRERY